VNCVVAVVSVHVVDFAVEDEPAPGNPLGDAPRYRPEVELIVLAEQSEYAENDLESAYFRCYLAINIQS